MQNGGSVTRDLKLYSLHLSLAQTNKDTIYNAIQCSNRLKDV